MVVRGGKIFKIMVEFVPHPLGECFGQDYVGLQDVGVWGLKFILFRAGKRTMAAVSNKADTSTRNRVLILVQVRVYYAPTA